MDKKTKIFLIAGTAIVVAGTVYLVRRYLLNEKPVELMLVMEDEMPDVIRQGQSSLIERHKTGEEENG